jgi:D-tyrosyl-tRNA(Tyr) deacylase
VRVVLQRVSAARVEVDGVVVGDLDGPGLVALVGVTHGDGPTQVEWMARKIAHLRVFDGPDGDESPGAERSAVEAGLPVPVAEPLVEAVAEALRAEGLRVATGTFGAHMRVHLVNDGPVTLVLDV